MSLMSLYSCKRRMYVLTVVSGGWLVRGVSSQKTCRIQPPAGSRVPELRSLMSHLTGSLKQRSHRVLGFAKGVALVIGV
jgi:hypothetical protein